MLGRETFGRDEIDGRDEGREPPKLGTLVFGRDEGRFATLGFDVGREILGRLLLGREMLGLDEGFIDPLLGREILRPPLGRDTLRPPLGREMLLPPPLRPPPLRPRPPPIARASAETSSTPKQATAANMYGFLMVLSLAGINRQLG
jgi:hypothetical protein